MEINRASIDGNGNFVIQGNDNSEITINSNNPDEIRKFFIDFQNQLNKLPTKILELMESKNPNDVEIKKGANIYFGLNIGISPYGGGIQGISFGVTITNLTKENRFFNSPFFKFSTEFEDGVDSFILLSRSNNIEFPKKLEYGEVASEDYPLKPKSKEVFEKIISKDKEATLKVVVNTTVGEVYNSNEYTVKRILDHFQYAK